MELPATRPGLSSPSLHSPWHRLCRKTSKKGMLMGWWLRRCSSICPRTSWGMGQGSYQGPHVLLPSAPAGLCQPESTRPSLSSRDSLMPPDPNPQRSHASPGPPGCSQPRCCSSASCRGWRTSHTPSAAPAGPAPAAAPCCAFPGLWTEPRGCPHGTSPPHSPCWRCPGGAGSQQPPAAPTETQL